MSASGGGRDPEDIILEQDIDWDSLCLDSQAFGVFGLDASGSGSGLLLPEASEWEQQAADAEGPRGAKQKRGQMRGNISDSANSSSNSIGSFSGRQPNKLLRSDSLTRIIIGSQLTGDSRHHQQQPQQQQPQQQQQQQQQQYLYESRTSRMAIIGASPSELVSLITDLFNTGDLDSLALLVELRVAEHCEVISSAIYDRSAADFAAAATLSAAPRDAPPAAVAAAVAAASAAAAKQPLPLRGRKYLMLMWGLQLELFPDSVWAPSPRAAGDDAPLVAPGPNSGESVVTRHFKFSGTRIYAPSTMALFEYVVNHGAIVDPTLPEPFSHTADGGLIIRVAAVGRAAAQASAEAQAGAQAEGSAAAELGSPPPPQQQQQQQQPLDQLKVVELLADLNARDRLHCYRHQLSSRNVLALASREGGEAVDDIDRSLIFVFDAQGQIISVVSQGDP